MTENSGSSTPALVVNYVDKITDAQTSIQQLYIEINKLKKDAQVDKFNMEALHQLSLIVAKSPHDKGVQLLTDILRYAHQFGIQLDTVVAQNDVAAEAQDQAAQAQDQNERNDHSDVSHFTPTHPLFGGRLSLIVQFALGILVAGSFIWFLR